MEFAKAQKYSVRVSDKYFVSENERYLYVKFELVSPDLISYRAGQYVSFPINEIGERRSYSIVSTPDDNHGFHILAEMVENGKGSEYLRNLKIGEGAEILGPLGRFVVQVGSAGEEKSNKLLFVATGSGIVPIYSMINDQLINKGDKRQIRLHWGMRSEADLFFTDNLMRLSEAHPNLVVDIVLSRPGETWELCRGHVQDCLMRDFAETKLEGWEAYVCGKPDKVIDIANKLVELGVKEEEIYREKFT
jgi:NAD(P)H-flavin reductase